MVNFSRTNDRYEELRLPVLISVVLTWYTSFYGPIHSTILTKIYRISFTQVSTLISTLLGNR